MIPPMPSMGPPPSPAASLAWTQGVSDPSPHSPTWPLPSLCQLQDGTSCLGLGHCWVPPPRVLGSQAWPPLGKGHGAGLSW